MILIGLQYILKFTKIPQNPWIWKKGNYDEEFDFTKLEFFNTTQHNTAQHNRTHDMTSHHITSHHITSHHNALHQKPKNRNFLLQFSSKNIFVIQKTVLLFHGIYTKMTLSNCYFNDTLFLIYPKKFILNFTLIYFFLYTPCFC